MNNHIEDFFKSKNLELDNQSLVVAVSTGVDSMVMLYSLLQLRDKYNLRIIVAHVNHQKREESIVEEEYIKNYALDLGFECRILKLVVNNDENFQSSARDKRYEFFKNAMEETKSNYLVLAHHLNDNMETIIMRMIRGSNLAGYSGMDAVTNFHAKLMIRPFLNILKNDLIEYAKLHKIKYYEDVSNQSDDYTRNRIRNKIVPLLFEESEMVHEKFLDFSNTLKEANLLLTEKVERFNKHIEFNNDYFGFNITSFLEETKFIQSEILFKNLKVYNLSKANIEEILKIINSKKKNIVLYYKSKFSIVKEYDKVYFYNKELKPEFLDIIVNDIGSYKLNDTLTIIVSKKDGNYIPKNNDLCYNNNMLPIRVRSRKNGDKILLTAGHKKVKDLLIDEKLGIIKRSKVLICEKDGLILSVMGIKNSSILKSIKNLDIIIRVEEKNG